MEPPPVEVEASAEFRDANRGLVEVFEQEGVTAALEAFTRVLGTTSWVAEREVAAPEQVARIERDATAFFTRDVPALPTWRFHAGRATAVVAPVLDVGGGDSGPGSPRCTPGSSSSSPGPSITSCRGPTTSC